MTRLLGRWAVLAPAMWVSVAAVLWFGFRTIDVRFEVFAALVIVPAVQAAALTWAMARRPIAVARISGDIRRLPFGSAAALVDVAMLAGGVLFWGGNRLGFGMPSSLQVVWAATKALAAGVFLLSRRDRESRATHVAAGLTAILIGASGFTTWLGALPGQIAGIVGHLPLVVAYLATYGLGLSLVVVLMLRLGRTRPANSTVRLLVECSVAAVLLAALVLVLNGFQYRVPMEPYRGLALLAASLAASALLLAAEMPATKDPQP